jgi:hypothetical protein
MVLLKLVSITEVGSTAGKSWRVRERWSKTFFLSYVAVP